jgi:hypothetical protein
MWVATERIKHQISVKSVLAFTICNYVINYSVSSIQLKSMNLKFFFLGTVLCMLGNGCRHQSAMDKYNASLMDFVFNGIDNTCKMNMIQLQAYYNENSEKYGEAYGIGEQVMSINQSFVASVDTMLNHKSWTIDDEEFYQLFVVTIDSLNDCLKRSGDLNWFDSRKFTEQNPKVNELTLLLAKQASTQYCSEILGYLAADMSFCGWHFPDVRYELVDNNRLVLYDKIFQRFENRAIEVSSLVKDGVQVEGKIRSKNSDAFCEISFDSLAPGNYKIEGTLKLLVGDSGFREERIEHEFTVAETE